MPPEKVKSKIILLQTKWQKIKPNIDEKLEDEQMQLMHFAIINEKSKIITEFIEDLESLKNLVTN